MVEQEAPAAYPAVELSGVGVVSLVALAELRAARTAEQAVVDRLAWQVEDMDRQVEDRLAEAGALLVPRRAWWEVPPGAVPHVAEAERLALRIAGLDQRIAAAGPEPDGLAATLRSWAGGGPRRERARASAALRQALVEVARAAVQAGARVPDAEPLLQQAVDVEARAGHGRRVLAEALARLGALHRELRVREEAERELGFDSLHLAAYFRAHGLPAVQVSLPLRPGEVAHLATAAALGRLPPGPRRTGGAGVRTPALACTGVRQWVGVFLNRAAPVQTPADRGTLVVTNQRVELVGGAEAVSVPLAAVLDVEVYADALAVYRLGREAPDLFLVAEPRHVAFYLNWALATSFRG